MRKYSVVWNKGKNGTHSAPTIMHLKGIHSVLPLTIDDAIRIKDLLDAKITQYLRNKGL